MKITQRLEGLKDGVGALGVSARGEWVSGRCGRVDS